MQDSVPLRKMPEKTLVSLAPAPTFCITTIVKSRAIAITWTVGAGGGGGVREGRRGGEERWLQCWWSYCAHAYLYRVEVYQFEVELLTQFLRGTDLLLEELDV